MAKSVFFTPIMPKQLKEDAIRLELLNAMRKFGTKIKKEFDRTTATWKTKVKFNKKISLRDGTTVEVFTDNQIYNWVNDGTKGPYPIPKPGNKNAKPLAFPGIFRPKTTRHVIGSTAGFKGGGTVVVKSVEHPGIKAREFDKKIMEIMKPTFEKAMEKAMKRAATASGHSG